MADLRFVAGKSGPSPPPVHLGAAGAMGASNLEFSTRLDGLMNIVDV